MKDAKTGNLAEKAVVLDQILCGDKQDMTAGEYMETLRTQECTAKEVTDIALVLVSHKNEFLNQTHFNDDYRFRILSWLARQAEGSMAAKAAHTTLVNLVIASDERLGREPSCQLAFSLAETAMETAASGDTLRAFLTCIAAPDIWDILGSSMHPDAPESQRKLRGLVEDFLTDREAVLANIPYIRMAFEFFFHAKQQGDGRMCRAFLDLYMKNVTTSSTSYKTLSQSYHRPCEIIALNLVCLHSTAPGPSPVMDNIMKNFLACIAGRNEGEPFTELEAETFRSVLGRSFSRKANGYERTKEYFCFLTEQFHNDYHTAARDEDSWERLYRTLGGTISFTEAGFLAFDPLDEGNRQRWDILSAQHKKQLLDYRCKDLFRVGLDSPYQEEWRGLAKIVQKRLTEIPVPANAQAQEPCSPAYTHRMQYAANTMIQAGLMDVPTGREYFWLLCVHPDMELQYLLQYYGEHGAVPGWTKKLIQNEKTTNETFDWVGGPVFTDMEKQKLCRILLDAAWDSNPCDYRYTALDFFLTHRELVGITFTQAEAASIAGILISCMALSDQDRQALMRYTMPEEEWEHQKQLEDRARMEQQKLEELQEFQEETRERLQTLIEDLTGKSSGFWFSRIKFANPAVKPELARIATLCIKEKDIPAASKIRHYAEIAEAAECDTYLFTELKNMIEEKK